MGAVLAVQYQRKVLANADSGVAVRALFDQDVGKEFCG